MTLCWYVRLRLAYKRHGVLPYSRRKTWGEARFTVRMGGVWAKLLRRAA